MDKFDELFMELSKQIIENNTNKNNLEEIGNCNVIGTINPLERMMRYILVFIFFSTFSIKLGPEILQIIFELLAPFMMIKACCICYTENNYLKTAYYTSIFFFNIRIVYVLVSQLTTISFNYFTAISPILFLIYKCVVFVCLSIGFTIKVKKEEINQKIEQNFKNIILSENLFVSFLILIFGNYGVNEKLPIIFEIILLAAAICKFIYQKSKLDDIRNNMIYYSYDVKLTSSKYRKKIQSVFLLEIILMLILVSGVIYFPKTQKVNKKVYAYEEKSELSDENADAIRQKLIDLGMKNDIVYSLQKTALEKLQNTITLKHTEKSEYMKNAEATLTYDIYIAEYNYVGNSIRGMILSYYSWDKVPKGRKDEMLIFYNINHKLWLKEFYELDDEDYVSLCDKNGESLVSHGIVDKSSYYYGFGRVNVMYTLKNALQNGGKNYRSYFIRDIIISKNLYSEDVGATYFYDSSDRNLAYSNENMFSMESEYYPVFNEQENSLYDDQIEDMLDDIKPNGDNLESFSALITAKEH